MKPKPTETMHDVDVSGISRIPLQLATQIFGQKKIKQDMEQ